MGDLARITERRRPSPSHCGYPPFRYLSWPAMPSLCAFQASILAMDKAPPTRLPEFNVCSVSESPPPPPPPAAAMTRPGSPTAAPLARTANPSCHPTCECYIPSTPGQPFRVQVSNHSDTDACVSLFVDGEWIYCGLSYGPNHKIIYFSGKLLDESTVQEMHFMDMDTTCTLSLFRKYVNCR